MVTATIGALITIALGGIGLARSPLMAVDQVALVGLTAGQQQAVAQTLAVHPGVNVLDVDMEMLEEQAQSLPWVQVATSRRRLPSTIEVRVALNTPVATTVVDGMRYLLDHEGTAVEAAPVADAAASLVSLTGPVEALPMVLVLTAPAVGVPSTDPQVRAAAGIAAAMPAVVADWVVGYQPGDPGEVDALMRFPTGEGPVEFIAHLGRDEDIGTKAATLAALVRETIGQGVRPRAVDVRIPDRPVVLT